MEDKTLILLEGNIAAGKSTVGRVLKESGMFDFIEEPVGAWQSGFASNLLEAFYRDMKRWAFTFQTMAFLTRAKTWRDSLPRTTHSRVVLERSLLTDRYVFARNSHRLGGMSDVEWQVYCELWDLVVSGYSVEPDCILYYRAPAEVCLERIKVRGREEETGISLDYLQQLEALHDEWLLDNPRAVILDGTRQWTANEILNELLQTGFLIPSGMQEADSVPSV